MELNDSILEQLIRQAMSGYESFRIFPYSISVEKNSVLKNCPAILSEINQVQEINREENRLALRLGNDKLVLANRELDIPVTATLALESLSNFFTTTRPRFSTLGYSRYQVFDSYLEARLYGYGDFIPFHLEFIRVSPIFKTPKP